MSGIHIKALNKYYGKVHAVQGIDLSIEHGQFMTLLGPSGSGKTTTLRMVAGLEQPESGLIEIDGRVLNGPGVSMPAHQRRMGMVFQSYAVWPHKTIYENVVFPLRMRGTTRGKDERERVERMLGLVGLPYAEFGERYPAQLSGGQQQRVALARALVGDPQVLLYDEPLSNLDARLRDSMRVLMRSIHDQLGVTSLYVTHDQVEAMVLSDQVCVMNNGRIIQQGRPRDLYERPNDVFVAEFIGQANVLAVVSSEPGNAAVKLAEGVVVQVPEDNRRGTSSAPRQLIVRHHQVKVHGIDQIGARPNTFAGVVRDVIYLGDRLRYTVELGPNCTLVAEVLPEGEQASAGARVGVELPGHNCIVL